MMNGQMLCVSAVALAGTLCLGQAPSREGPKDGAVGEGMATEPIAEPIAPDADLARSSARRQDTPPPQKAKGGEDSEDPFQRYDARLLSRLRGQPHTGIDPLRLIHHLPDPERVYRDLLARKDEGTAAQKRFTRRLLERLETVRRPNRIGLRLEDVMRRALANSFAIEVRRYNPAIESTRVVEAQAAFDAVFFSNVSKSITDRPTGSQLTASDFDFLRLDGGVRQLLPTGMQIETKYSMTRTFTSLSFQQLNPEYFSQFTVSFRQPLLRGFGIDYNLSAIRITRNDRRISDLQFYQDIRDLLRELEVAYWRLVLARRDLVITAHLLEEFEDVYQYLLARKDFDVTKIQIEDTRANLETSRADFLRKKTSLRNAEDQLIVLMNDPHLDLVGQYEIFPEELPTIGSFTVDRLGELQTALDMRPEIRQSKLRVANAKIAVGQAINQALPRLDLSLSYVVDGIGKSADRSFDEVTKHNFTEYAVGVELEFPIGNRAGKASERRSRLLHSQAQAAVRQQIENVILEANVALRELGTTYEQILPRFESAEAAERQVESILARAERKDFTQLNAELGARSGLASSRLAMLQAIIDYNIAIIDLERAKGTLLQYNNVEIAPDRE